MSLNPVDWIARRVAAYVLKPLENLMSALDDAVARLQASAAASTDATQAAITALHDLQSQVAAGQDHSTTVTALGAIAAQLDSNTAALTSVTAPPAPPAPVEAPTDAPVA